MWASDLRRSLQPRKQDSASDPSEDKFRRKVSGKSSLSNSVSVIVPARNTSGVVVDVLRSLIEDAGSSVRELLVIDNASTDGTADVVRSFCEENSASGVKVELSENPTNLGYGGSIKQGFSHLVDRAEYVAIVHSDGQCDAALTLRAMVDALDKQPRPNVVLASRFVEDADTSKYNVARRLGNVFFNLVTRLLSGYRMSDAGTGIMLIDTEALAKLPFDRLTSGYRFHPQLNLLIYGDPDITVREVPLNWMDARVGDSFSLITYGWALLRMLFVYAWYRRIRRKSLADAVVAANSRHGP